MLSASGQSALGVAERSPGISKGRLDAWGVPTGTSLARKASSGAPASAEPASKKRKGSDSAAVDANNASVKAGTSLDGQGAFGEAALHILYGIDRWNPTAVMSEQALLLFAIAPTVHTLTSIHDCYYHHNVELVVTLQMSSICLFSKTLLEQCQKLYSFVVLFVLSLLYPLLML